MGWSFENTPTDCFDMTFCFLLGPPWLFTPLHAYTHTQLFYIAFHNTELKFGFRACAHFCSTLKGQWGSTSTLYTHSFFFFSFLQIFPPAGLFKALTLWYLSSAQNNIFITELLTKSPQSVYHLVTCPDFMEEEQYGWLPWQQEGFLSKEK